ncbi:restriction endonuclease subunit S [Trichlorobacter lovleyi]|uniref:restriction endonuclease subunit S n=1 Tax=Trichlorobacter lovleyi TaxID=313985 RepID=UPI002240A441|nr:restriction endonuclease subunit S [Trichlorobacter lovleyi]QOX79845.1 restriction endonuclease subunit S [Trichlorobacter lovleyi]
MELKPGYKQTEVGVIPEDWSVKCFGETCWVNQGLQIAIQNRKKHPSEKSKIYITIQFLNDGKEAEYIDVYTSSVCCGNDDVLMTRTGNTGIVVTNVDGVFHNNFFKINFDKQLVDKDFLVYSLTSPSMQKTILTKAGTSTIPDLNHNDFYSINTPLPPLPEQRAIAAALSDVDALIASLDKLIAKKRDMKQAAMQKLLTGKRRLPGFSGEWEVKRLGEVSEISMGRTPSRRNASYWGRGYKWLSIADLQEKVVSESKEEITELAASEMAIIPKGTLLMSFKLSIGRLCFAGCNLFTNEAICSFNKLQADANYLYYALNRVDFSLYGKQAVKGYTLNKESLQLVEVPYPTIPEQTAIAAILSDMDTEIASLEQKRDKTRLLKQGMMQELLTGRIRLVNSAEALHD